MRVVVIIGGGCLSASMRAALVCAGGVTVIVARPVVESLLSLTMPGEALGPSKFAQPMPFSTDSAKNLRKSEISQVSGVQRTGKRSRELRPRRT